MVSRRFWAEQSYIFFSFDFKAFFFFWKFWSWILLYNLRYSFSDHFTLSRPDLRSTCNWIFFLKLKVVNFLLLTLFKAFSGNPWPFLFLNELKILHRFFCEPGNKITVLQHIRKQLLCIWYSVPLILSVWTVRSKIFQKCIFYSFNKYYSVISTVTFSKTLEFSNHVSLFMLDSSSTEWWFVEMFS